MFKNINKQIEKTILELEIKAKAGDKEAQYDLFVFLNAKAMEEYDMSIFNKAEIILEKSANNNWPEAIVKFGEQPIRRRAFEGRVKRHEET